MAFIVVQHVPSCAGGGQTILPGEKKKKKINKILLACTVYLWIGWSDLLQIFM